MMPAQKMFVSGGGPSYFTVDLNEAWQEPTKWTNSDARFVVYESFSNYNVDNSVAMMYVTVNGLTSLTLFINSYAESSYDYTLAFDADADWDVYSKGIPNSSSDGVKASTEGYQYDPSSYAIDSGTGWKAVTYALDGGEHKILICYRKDGSASNSWDRGYVAIPAKKDGIYAV